MTLLAYAAYNVECEIARVAAAERSNSLLLVATELLGAALDAETVLSRIASAVVPALADTCAIYAFDESGHLRRFACAHRDPERERRLRQLDGRIVHPTATRVMESGGPVLLADVPPADSPGDSAPSPGYTPGGAACEPTAPALAGDDAELTRALTPSCRCARPATPTRSSVDISASRWMRRCPSPTACGPVNRSSSAPWRSGRWRIRT